MKNTPDHLNKNESSKRFTPLWRMLIEVGFIIFLFYSNLLMGEYSQSGAGRQNGFAWALQNIFTLNNFIIAIVAAFIGYFLFGYVRRKL